MADSHYDLIVLGTGPAAAAAIWRARETGWSVAAIDRREPGGTCSLRGCDPKKVLLAGEEGLDWLHRMSGRGIESVDARIKWPELMHFKRSFTDPIPQATRDKYRKMGVDFYKAEAHFISPDSLMLGERIIRGRKFLIATGSMPRLDCANGECFLCHSDTFMDLEYLPKQITFVGGGYISFEFAHLAAYAGAEVTILSGSPRPLKMFEPDLVEKLISRSESLGIRIFHNARVESVEKEGEHYALEVKGWDSPHRTHFAVHGAGRVAAVEALLLDKGNIERGGHGGIAVNEYLQSTTNPHVYAAGDCAESPGYPLTPVAGAEGRTAALNMLDGNNHTLNYAGIPTVVFSLPNLARVGLLEDEAREQNLDYEVRQGDMEKWFSHRRIAADCAAFKVLIEKKTGVILGAHLLGHHSAEVINLFALAMRHGLTRDQLRDNLFSYPTHSSDVLSML
jgi:glutathione reductase (NADPH)